MSSEEDTNIANNITPPSNLGSYILGILASLSLVFIAFLFVPLLNIKIQLGPQALDLTEHVNLFGIDFTYALFIQIIFIATSITCCIRYSLNYFLDLKNNNPRLAKGLLTLNQCIAAMMWIVMGFVVVYSSYLHILDFKNDFNWWFEFIVPYFALFIFYVVTSFFIINKVINKIPDFVSICTCLILSIISPIIIVLQVMAIGIVFTIILVILGLKALSFFIRLVR